MGIYHDIMDRETGNGNVNSNAAEVDVSFFVFTQTEELEDYEEIVAYWVNEIDKELLGFES
jgi:hypothetical protein